MAGKKQYLLTLAATLRLENGGLASLVRGDEIPSKADNDELERLERLGHVGDEKALAKQAPFVTAAPTGDLVDAAEALFGKKDEEPDAEVNYDEVTDEQLAELDAKTLVSVVDEHPALAERIGTLEESREKPRKTVQEAVEAAQDTE